MILSDPSPFRISTAMALLPGPVNLAKEAIGMFASATGFPFLAEMLLPSSWFLCEDIARLLNKLSRSLWQ
jgi:hypothetical protein